jgi:hypothetical protein
MWKVVWPAVLLSLGPVLRADPPDAPFDDDADTIALWHFDGSGANAAAAASPTAVVRVPGAAFTATGGRFGGALRVNGATALIPDADIPELDAAIAGTKDFTIELWVRPAPDDLDGSKPTTGLLEHYLSDAAPSRGFDLRIDNVAAGLAGRPSGTPGLVYFRSGDAPTIHTATNAISVSLLDGYGGSASEVPLVADLWQHIALTRQGNNWKLWINGQVTAFVVSSFAMPDSAQPLFFGAIENGLRPLSGMIDEVRISRVARNPATPGYRDAPFTGDADTIGLWHFDGNGENAAPAASPRAVVRLESTNLAAFETTGGRFGGSLFINGGRAFVNDADIPELDATIAGTGEFTIEAWVRPAPGDVDGSLPSTGILEHYSVASPSSRGFDWRVDNLPAGTAGRPSGTPGLVFLRSGDYGGIDTGSSGMGVGLLSSGPGLEVALTPDVWHHVAVTRKGNTWTQWVDGVFTARVTSAWSVPDSDEPLIFGAVESFIRPMGGRIDEVRISKVARVYGEEPPPPPPVFVPDPRPPAHLFLDDYEIASMSNLTRVLHQPIKQGMVVDHDRPWEDWAADFPVVLRDASGFHMYYRAIYREGAPPVPSDPSQQGVSSTCYAFSADGLHWTKPNLGLREIKGTLDNNTLPVGGVSAAIWQPHHPDPSRRYLFMTGGGSFTGSNPVSGWAAYGPGALRGGGLNYEPHQEMFAAYGQTEQPRTIYRYTSADLLSWADQGKVLEADDLDHRLPADTDEFYGMGVQQEGTLTIGFLWVFHTDRTDPEYTTPYSSSVWRKGLIDIQLVASRDGVQWTRVADRQTWLPLGPDGSFDDGMVFVGGPGVRVGNEMWFYYGAWDGDHLTFTASGQQFEEPLREGRIGLAAIRRDGFVSLSAGVDDDEGILTTRTYTVDRERLLVNVNAASGSLAVELLDGAGAPIPGYTLADCDPIHADSVALPVRWVGRTDLTPLMSQAIRIRFHLRSGDLYGFSFAGPAGDFDGDGDADLADFTEFQACFNGPNRPPAGPLCEAIDLDTDDDVDLADFLEFQTCFNGPNRPVACP